MNKRGGERVVNKKAKLKKGGQVPAPGKLSETKGTDSP